MSYWGDYYESSGPVEVSGGIKLQSGTKGTKSKQNWWAARWIEALEKFSNSARLTRGKSYARRGQVLSIDISSGLVKAEVQGSRPRPYKVEVKVAPLSDSDWERALATISGQAGFVAELLNRRIPPEIEQLLSGAGVQLFPAGSRDLETHCSCPDWSNPCKHVAAVHYLIGEAFDNDPFLLFRLRGMDSEDLLTHLGGHDTAGGEREATPEMPDEASLEASLESAGQFWSGEAVEKNAVKELRVPPVRAALPKRLGPVPFWRGSESFLESMENIYTYASSAVLATLERE